MIVDVIQTKTNFDLEWDILCENKQIAKAQAPFLLGVFIAEIKYGENLRKLYYNPKNTTYGSSIVDRQTFRVFDHNKCIGSILGKNKMIKKFLASYPYYEYVDNGETYLVYEVGFGKKGLYLCFYKNDELICICEKDQVIVNYQDKYRCYFEDEQYLMIVATFVIYYDTIKYSDFMKISLFSRKETLVNTYQEELKAKFDPAFIPKIKAMHGIYD